VEFAVWLRRVRSQARLSQLALALQAGVSQRHLSFLESGRARPGRDTVLKLAQALRLAPEVANALLQSAGFAAAFDERPWAAPELAPLRAAAAQILIAHTPSPAVLVDVSGDVIDTNAAFDRALAALGDAPTLWRQSHGDYPRNLYRLTLHPRGTAQFLVNFDEVAAATLRRAAAEANASPRLAALLIEIATWPRMNPGWLDPDQGPPPTPVIVEQYRVGDAIVGVIAVTTTFGAPMDLVGGGLRIESYFPADEASAAVLSDPVRNPISTLPDAGPRVSSRRQKGGKP
jgi:transcriptional regulator with XRE-family HTH domain